MVYCQEIRVNFQSVNELSCSKVMVADTDGCGMCYPKRLERTKPSSRTSLIESFIRCQPFPLVDYYKNQIPRSNMGTITLEFIILFLLIVFNGLLSMSELAVISARKARLQQMADEGISGAAKALALAASPGQFLSTVQIGITLVGILAGAFGGATIARWLGEQLANVPVVAAYAEPLSVGVVVVFVTYLSLVIGELVPKHLALRNAEMVAARVAGPLTVLARVMRPLVRLLNASTDLFCGFYR